MAEMSQATRDYIRSLGREWARNNPDPERDAEVTRLLRRLPSKRAAQQAADQITTNPEA